jgi:uncharacterized membrane protein
MLPILPTINLMDMVVGFALYSAVLFLVAYILGRRDGFKRADSRFQHTIKGFINAKQPQ